MNTDSKPAPSAISLRTAVIDHYISTSSDIHHKAGSAEIAAFARAYCHYLRGWLPEKGEGHWLDLGCGQGLLMNLARDRGYTSVEGVDLSLEMLATAQGQGLVVRQEDVFAAVERTAASSCAVVSCFDLLEHLSKDDGFRLLRGIAKILQPGGLLLVKLPNAYSPWGMGITADDLTHEAAYTEATLIQLGRIAGFASGEVREVGPLPLSVAGAVRCVLWKMLRSGIQLCDIVETGRPRTSAYTRVMLGRFIK